jgi:hypothetical protein
MPTHGLFVGVLELALAVEMDALLSQRRGVLSPSAVLLIWKWCRPGLPQEWISDGERGLSREAAQIFTGQSVECKIV